MYRFALRPRWLLSHVLVLTLIIAMISAGFWQLRRLDQRQTRNALITARAEEPPADIGELIDLEADDEAAEDVRFRSVEVEGAYDEGSDVLVRNRTYEEQPGSWLLATLRLPDGNAVVVNRGWVPVTGEQEPDPDSLAPSGSVRVEGIVETTQERGRFGSIDPEEGTLQRVARVDVERLAEQIDGDVYPVWVQTRSEQPDPGDLPVSVAEPELGEGSHFAYAVQWFIFSLIAVIGYPIVLRRVARQADGPPAPRDAPAWDAPTTDGLPGGTDG